ncbi:PAS domain S-box protein [Rhizobium mesoamericanum]|uniref:Blue-light-activated histidine kinase n=1 Tax=Rhizobium mesoamericanum STM3625 TaxID=1211777 RepID=K0Q2A6_9HYPH|nr:PAS domain S-box protein [Rhizobium mesoamericanum]CCM78262.1 Signal transduction histidine kinase [Rhizobium mesoamericanum STM3625]
MADARELERLLADAKTENDALRESEAKFRAVFETMIEACCIFEMIYDDVGRPVDWKILEANAGYEKQSGLKDVAGKLASEVMPGTEAYWTETFGRVVQTGEAEQIEKWHQPTGRWIHSSTARVGGSGSRRLVSVFYDITERKRAEIALRESEERQAFLLELSDTLRPLADPAAIQLAAATVLGRHLGASRVAYGEDTGDGETFVVSPNYVDGAPDMSGTFRYADYGSDILADLRAGHNRIQPDLAQDERLSEAERGAFAEAGIGASLNVPLVKAGRLVAWLGVNYATPHEFTLCDIQLTEEAAERTWAAVERARAEAALRVSEERFQQFANASAAALWMRNAETLNMEFVSPAIATIYGTAPDTFIGDIRRWAAMIVPEDRDTAMNHINQARNGEPAVHEFRIRRNDGSFRWIRDTDFPLCDEKGNVERIGGIAEDVTETKMAVEHQGVLLAELQHRVRNIMAIIRSTVVRSADGAGDVENYKVSLAGRLLALARVQTLLTRQANAGGSLRGILESEIGAQAHSENQYELTGPDLMLSPKAVEVLTLAFHELATNALKYGALSVNGGKVSVTWTLFEKREKPWLAIDWVEEGAPFRPPSTRRGFGSELIEAKIPYELRGTGKTSIEPGGAHCHIEFPLREAESILETDAPAPTRLYGGTVDMTGAPDLTGKTVLVVEDDYYIASDTAAALRGAGAEVLGPCPTEEDVLRLLEEETPTAVVLDLNLGGGGPRFEIARKLVERGTPFVFLTGYNPDVIPDELADVTRLQKPITLRDIVEAVSKL